MSSHVRGAKQKGSGRNLMVGGALLVLTALSLLFVAIKYPIAAAFFYSIVIVAVAVGFYFMYSVFFIRRPLTVFGEASPRLFGLSIAASGVIAVLLEFLTLVGSPLSSPVALNNWSVLRLALFFVISFFSCTSYVVYSKGVICKDSTRLSISRRRFARRSDRTATLIIRSALAISIVVVALVLLSILVSILFGANAGELTLISLCALSCFITLLLYAIRKIEHLSICFLAIALFSGSYLAFGLPPVTALSWDDQIHYDRALGLSYLGTSEYSLAEKALVDIPWAHVGFKPELVDDVVEGLHELEGASRDHAEYMVNPTLASPVLGHSLADVTSIGYIPSAAGLWLSRLLNLPVMLSVIVGRWFNLIAYVVVIAAAIHIVPTKKVLVAVIGLLPTSLFLAASYSYDTTVTAFILLSVAMIFREISNKNEPLTAVSLFKIIATMFIGLAPKAIYFPFIGLLFMMPRSKFTTAQAYRRYFCIVILFGVLMVSSFILPLLFSTAVQAGDSRGGTDVNAAGQVLYILSHPLAFLDTLTSFLVSYLSPANSDMYTVFYAYVGLLTAKLPWIAVVALIVVVAAAASGIGAERDPLIGLLGRLWMLFLTLVTVALVATALYVSFTPVGLDTVNGCQPRYLLPVLFVGLLSIFPVERVERSFSPVEISRSTLSSSVVRFSSVLPIVIMLVIGFACNWLLAFPW